MPALLLYLLKVNLALVLFYLAYRYLLRPLTFYTLNRFFMLFGIVFSFLYPFMDVAYLLRQHQVLNSQFIVSSADWQVVELLPEQTLLSDFWQVLALLFWAGVFLMAFRLLGQLLSLHRIYHNSSRVSYQGIRYRQLGSQINPFSFWQTIYLNPTLHRPEELDSILKHEQVHVQQWHSLDVLLCEFCLVMCWFNPGAWLLKQAVKENLEFFTDQEMLKSGVDSKAYQYSLLRISSMAQGTGLVNNFNFFTIKKRIAMMNKRQSPLRHITRYAVLLPLMLIPAFVFTACTEDAEITSPVDAQELEQNLSKVEIRGEGAEVALYYIDGKEVTNDTFKKLDPKAIESINVLKGEAATQTFGDEASDGIILITTKKNKDAPEVLRFNEKLLKKEL